jgi:hypothetical protein
MKKFRLLYIMFIFSIYSYSQKTTTETTFWKLTSLTGEVNLEASYWDQEITRSNFNERLTTSILSGGIFLNSNSYFYHPNFLSLDLDVGYSPETGQRLSLVTPNRFDQYTLSKLYVKASFFQKNSLNFSMFTNLHESYSNRENLTNLRSKFINWGGTLLYSNKYVPFSVSYNRGRDKQIELQTDRTYITKQNNFETRATKSFGLNDWNEFVFSRNEYAYEDTFVFPGLDEPSIIVKNNITSWNLTNRFYFDSKKNYSFNSRISNDDQVGDFNYKRFQVFENIFLKLPKDLNFYGNYNFFKYKTDVQDSEQNNVRGALSHQLYKSLRTSISAEYNSISNTQYEERIKRFDLDIRYVKKIPLNGLLSLSFKINDYPQQRIGDGFSLIIQDEVHTLTDGQIELLNNQNVNTNTVTVKDLTGTVVYRLNFDYVLIERNEFLEIQRIPGGLIANNASVLIDYIAIQPLSYKYDAIFNFYGANVSLFKSKLEFYFNVSEQDYINTENTEFLALNYFNRNVYGSRFRYSFISGGIEHDNFRSTIIPYRLTRFYLNLQGNIKQKIFYTLNGDIINYHMIEEEGKKQKYVNFSGNVSYNFNPKSKLNLEAAYRTQEGEALDLNFLTARLQFKTRFRQLFFTAGVEIYKNELFDEKINYKRATIEISRKF